MIKTKKEIATAGLTAAVAAVAGAQMASAADPMPVEEAAAFDWSGVYIGGAVGAIIGGDFPINFNNDYDAESDFIFGGFIGVNHQFDSGIVVGGEVAVQSGFDGDGNDEDNDYEVNYIVDGKLKLGFAMDEFMVYAFGGPSFLHATVGEDSEGDNDYGFGGINYGIGADWMVTEQFSIGAEFLARTVIDPYAWSSGDSTGDDQTHYQAMLRAAFHF